MTFFINRLLTTSTTQVQRLVGSLRDRWQRDRVPFLHELISDLPPSAKSLPQGAYFDFHDVKLTIEFKTVGTIEIQWQTQTQQQLDRVVVAERQPLQVKFNTTAVGWQLTTTQMRVHIYTDGRLDVRDRTDRLLRQEAPPQQFSLASEPHMACSWQHRAKLQPTERIYGLGERLQPRERQGISVYIGLHLAGCYLVFYDSPHDGSIKFTDEAIASFAGDAFKYYISVGELPALLDAYTQISGRPALPPRWAFGYHHCRWDESAPRTTAVGTPEAPNLPPLAIHLDIKCSATLKPFTLDTIGNDAPTLKEFAAELTAAGLNPSLILHPRIGIDLRDPFFQAGIDRQYFCTNLAGESLVAPLWAGNSDCKNFTNPAARSVWSQQYQRVLNLGFSGFWHDPDTAASSSGDEPIFSTQITDRDVASGNIKAGNLAGLQQAVAGYDRLRSALPDKRPFILTRSGGMGIQKYAWVWTGDTTLDWDSLRQMVPTILNLGLSGIPFSGSDIGGFRGNPSPELLLRWFQLSCFLPLCRTHGDRNSRPKLPEDFGDALSEHLSQRVLEGIRTALNLRSALLPYFYTLACEAHHSGAPLVRPLFWNATARADLWDVEDTFLFGDALLIAPIVTQGQPKREIRLPPGDWYDFWSERTWSQQNQITVPVDLVGTGALKEHRIPVLVKAGSILPMTAAQRLILHCYPDLHGSCAGTVYSDAGDGDAPGRIDRFELVCDCDKWQLNWEVTGDYPFPYDAVRFTMYGMDLDEVSADECPIDFTEGIFTIAPFQSLTFTGSLRSLG